LRSRDPRSRFRLGSGHEVGPRSKFLNLSALPDAFGLRTTAKPVDQKIITSVDCGQVTPAPTPAAVKMRVFGFIDWSLAGSLVEAQALDRTSAEECLRRPWHSAMRVSCRPRWCQFPGQGRTGRCPRPNGGYCSHSTLCQKAVVSRRATNERERRQKGRLSGIQQKASPDEFVRVNLNFGRRIALRVGRHGLGHVRKPLIAWFHDLQLYRLSACSIHGGYILRHTRSPALAAVSAPSSVGTIFTAMFMRPAYSGHLWIFRLPTTHSERVRRHTSAVDYRVSQSPTYPRSSLSAIRSRWRSPTVMAVEPPVLVSFLDGIAPTCVLYASLIGVPVVL
jgi:hypothetical protein